VARTQGGRYDVHSNVNGAKRERKERERNSDTTYSVIFFYLVSILFLL
jgi:hypothetical protein